MHGVAMQLIQTLVARGLLAESERGRGLQRSPQSRPRLPAAPGAHRQRLHQGRGHAPRDRRRVRARTRGPLPRHDHPGRPRGHAVAAGSPQEPDAGGPQQRHPHRRHRRPVRRLRPRRAAHPHRPARDAGARPAAGDRPPHQAALRRRRRHHLRPHGPGAGTTGKPKSNSSKTSRPTTANWPSRPRKPRSSGW